MFDPKRIVDQLISTGVAGGLAGVFPALKAMRLSIIEALAVRA